MSREQHRVRQPVLPHGAPSLPNDFGIGRKRVVHEECRTPDQVFIQKTPAHIVGIIGIPIISGTERDDRFQRPGGAGSDLKRIEAAPGDPEHSH